MFIIYSNNDISSVSKRSISRSYTTFVMSINIGSLLLNQLGSNNCDAKLLLVWETDVTNKFIFPMMHRTMVVKQRVTSLYGKRAPGWWGYKHSFVKKSSLTSFWLYFMATVWGDWGSCGPLVGLSCLCGPHWTCGSVWPPARESCGPEPSRSLANILHCLASSS